MTAPGVGSHPPSFLFKENRIMTDNSTLSRLMAWRRDHSNGDWEHSFRIRISTLDNPGWSVDINLEDTDLEDRDFAAKKILRSDAD